MDLNDAIKDHNKTKERLEEINLSLKDMEISFADLRANSDSNLNKA